MFEGLLVQNLNLLGLFGVIILTKGTTVDKLQLYGNQSVKSTPGFA